MAAAVEPASSRLNLETLDFILNWTRDAPMQQERAWEAADTKGVQILSVASIVLGLAGISSIRSGSPPDIGGPWVLVPMGLGVIAYLFAAVGCFVAIFGRDFHRALAADRLWLEFWASDLAVLKHGLAEKITNVYATNKAALNQKASWLQVAVTALACETFLVTVSLIAARLTALA